MYFKYLSAAFGSALISSIYGIMDMAMVYQREELLQVSHWIVSSLQNFDLFGGKIRPKPMIGWAILFSKKSCEKCPFML